MDLREKAAGERLTRRNAQRGSQLAKKKRAECRRRGLLPVYGKSASGRSI